MSSDIKGFHWKCHVLSIEGLNSLLVVVVLVLAVVVVVVRYL